MSTAKKASPISGDKLYQIRARATLPLLVRQAKAGNPIYYSDLARELNIPNPRNLNYVLGSIGKALEQLAEEWGTIIPPIQCLVCNKSTKLPGEGIGWFLDKNDKNKKLSFSGLSNKQKKTIIDRELEHIYIYQDWDKVLKALSLKPAKTDFTTFIDDASNFKGGGESPGHKALKEFIARNPMLIGLKKIRRVVKMKNYYLPEIV